MSLTINRPKPIYGDAYIGLMSDLHIGHNIVDYGKIKEELQEYKDKNARISINGDIFDAITTRDKRYTPESIHSRLQGRNDIMNAAIEWAAEILSPFSTNIDVIGIGNHDLAPLKYHNYDMVRGLINLLDQNSDTNISYGGYTGFIDYRIRPQSSENKDKISDSRRFVIYYHHGSGGGGAVTKGITEFSRKQFVRADCIWLGHVHSRYNVHTQTLECPMSGDQPITRDVRYIRSGAYMNPYVNDSKENYAATWGVSPEGLGGALIKIKLGSSRNKDVVRVIQ